MYHWSPFIWGTNQNQDQEKIEVPMYLTTKLWFFRLLKMVLSAEKRWLWKRADANKKTELFAATTDPFLPLKSVFYELKLKCLRSKNKLFNYSFTSFRLQRICFLLKSLILSASFFLGGGDITLNFLFYFDVSPKYRYIEGQRARFA